MNLQMNATVGLPQSMALSNLEVKNPKKFTFVRVRIDSGMRQQAKERQSKKETGDCLSKIVKLGCT